MAGTQGTLGPSAATAAPARAGVQIMQVRVDGQQPRLRLAVERPFWIRMRPAEVHCCPFG